MGKVTAAQYAASSLSSLPGAHDGAPDRLLAGQQTDLDCLAEQACGLAAHPVWSFPQNTPLPLSQDFYRLASYPAGYSGHTPRHQLARWPARWQADSDILSNAWRVTTPARG